MHVTHLSLTDFRCYEQVDLELRQGVTSLVGANGQGKTNLVEALGYLAGLSSHRVSQDAPLIRQGAQRAVVRAALQRGARRLTLEIEIVPSGSNRARINRNAVPRTRELLGHLRTVLFAPEDLGIVKGDPDGRRRFLDELLVARAPRFAGVRSELDKVLRQRNALLKTSGAALRSGRAETHTLDVWDEHLARAGAELLHGRLHLVQQLRPHVARAYEAVADGRHPAALTYRSGLGDDVTADAPPTRAELAHRYVRALAGMRRQELDRGLTLVGPQRDDLTLHLGELPAKGYASHGESWSLALALRLGSYELLRADPGADGDGEPVLVLDDVFAELDAGRRRRLVGLVAGAEQVLVTAAVAEDVPDELRGDRVDVADGLAVRHG